MNLRFLYFVLFSIFTGLASLTNGQDISKDTVSIEEVVVTGTPVKINRNNVPMSVSVVSQAQLNESSESAVLPVLSGTVPGLFVTEKGIKIGRASCRERV